ncbi:ATP-binding protein [Mucilaginibacter sp. McL0603]|uniref:ATP-binding protein n=1 Tax=Mucilaginibacter sp. McL0603 TaxID=3415670 RepID=UPI003CFAE470
MPTGSKASLFGRLSIQQRLPLLICSFLLSAIVIYGCANYYSLKKATLIIGQSRVNTLTTQMSSMFGQSAMALVKTEHATAKQNAVIQFLKSNGQQYRQETLSELDKLYRDSTWVSIELLDQNLVPVLRSGKSAVSIKIPVKDVLKVTPVGPDSCKIGRLYIEKDAMYYPAIAAVTDNECTIGYVVCWQRLLASPQAVAQFSLLMGTGSKLYIGNKDGSIWTDMIRPAVGPPFKVNHILEPIEYTDHDNGLKFAQAQPIPQTSWVVAIEFSEQSMLSGVNSFMKWIFIFGALLTAIGILAAWIMSRNITRPLNQLTIAAKEISQGNYSTAVSINVYSNDELGELATAFNVMSAEIFHTWQNLDNKVKERTTQLELVNKELEAFSYSVSHDLRTPLRAINGYSIMLKEDYEEKLDAEGKRIIGNVITNARMMGQLIDDLLAFSRLGKKEFVSTGIDMQSLSTNVVNELIQHNLEKDYLINIGLLPPTEADQGMIKQVLINLLGNAIKYSSKKDRPEIEIGSKDEETRTIYYVKDNGVGFDMTYAGKLFGVFQRLHSQEEFEGTGVGLALVKRIIDKHKGEVWAEGQENIGATFYFSLPKKSYNGR